MNPGVTGLSEVEKQGIFQDKFNKQLKAVAESKKEILLSHIRNAHNKTQKPLLLIQFFATKSKDSSVPYNALSDIDLIDHIMSFIEPRFSR